MDRATEDLDKLVGCFMDEVWRLQSAKVMLHTGILSASETGLVQEFTTEMEAKATGMMLLLSDGEVRIVNHVLGKPVADCMTLVSVATLPPRLSTREARTSR